MSNTATVRLVAPLEARVSLLVAADAACPAVFSSLRLHAAKITGASAV